VLKAAAGRGIEPDDMVIVPNARSELAGALSRCRVSNFRELKISDGLVGYRFELAADEQSGTLQCLRKTIPLGAWVEEDKLH
jgi:hypothetical protein